MYSKINQLNKNINIIKGCTIFFAVLTAISMIATLIMAVKVGSVFSELSEMFRY